MSQSRGGCDNALLSVFRECIHRVCDAMNRKTPKKRNADKRVLQYINAQPCMEHGAGSSVSLQISSRCCEIKSESNETIARHDMPRISFASGGDAVSHTSLFKFIFN
jgi:SHC-transforming protein 1